MTYSRRARVRFTTLYDAVKSVTLAGRNKQSWPYSRPSTDPERLLSAVRDRQQDVYSRRTHKYKTHFLRNSHNLYKDTAQSTLGGNQVERNGNNRVGICLLSIGSVLWLQRSYSAETNPHSSLYCGICLNRVYGFGAVKSNRHDALRHFAFNFTFGVGCLNFSMQFCCRFGWMHG